MEFEPARPLTERGLENLVALTRLLGYVRHFHPSDEAAAVDWGRFAVAAVRAVEPSGDALELVQTLEALFRTIAPTVQVFPSGEQQAVSQELCPPEDAPSLRVTMWRHWKGESERLSEAAPKGRTPGDFLDPRMPYSAALSGGVACRVPLAGFADAGGTLPRAASSQEQEAPQAPPLLSGNDRAVRLAVVALGWNILQHFYPYFDQIDTDWPRVLQESLCAAASDPDARAFLATLRRMVAQLNDGHGWVSHRRHWDPVRQLFLQPRGTDAVNGLPTDDHDYLPPFGWSWIEGCLVVTDTSPDGPANLRPGDVVLTVDGRPTAAALAEEERCVSAATPERRRYRALRELLAGPEGSVVALEVRCPDGEEQRVTARRTLLSWDPFSLGYIEPRPPAIDELQPGLFYLDFTRIGDDEFYEVLLQLEQARGIIIDLRGYASRITVQTLKHLTGVPLTSPPMGFPYVLYPDRAHSWIPLTQWEPVPPATPRLKASIAFLTDERAMSWGETYLAIVEQYRLGEIVGARTAGTNGRMNEHWTLPGGYTLCWTEQLVLRYDGSPHHGIGIRPTVPVSRTLRGVAEGRDELLESAIEIMSDMKGARSVDATA